MLKVTVEMDLAEIAAATGSDEAVLRRGIEESGVPEGQLVEAVCGSAEGFFLDMVLNNDFDMGLAVSEAAGNLGIDLGLD